MSSRASSAQTLFLGAKGEYTTSPAFYYPKQDDLPAVMPCYRIIDDDGVVWGATERGFLVGMKFVLLSGEGATLTYQLTHLLPCIRRGIPTVGGF